MTPEIFQCYNNKILLEKINESDEIECFSCGDINDENFNIPIQS